MANEIDFSEYGPFDEVYRLDQINWAKLFHPYIPDGVVQGLRAEMKPWANAAGMIVYVSSGECRVRGHRGDLQYSAQLDIAPAHPSYKRIDTIVARVTYGNAPTSKMKVVVKTGTPATSPVAPGVTQIEGDIWEMRIGDVHVNPGVTNIAASAVIDRRLFSRPGSDVDLTTIFYFGGF